MLSNLPIKSWSFTPKFAFQVTIHFDVCLTNFDGRDKQQDLGNLLGAMYASVLFLGAMNATSVQPVVAVERTIFYRERAAGMYSALPYAFGQVQKQRKSNIEKPFEKFNRRLIKTLN